MFINRRNREISQSNLRHFRLRFRKSNDLLDQEPPVIVRRIRRTTKGYGSQYIWNIFPTVPLYQSNQYKKLPDSVLLLKWLPKDWVETFGNFMDNKMVGGCIAATAK